MVSILLYQEDLSCKYTVIKEKTSPHEENMEKRNIMLKHILMNL